MYFNFKAVYLNVNTKRGNCTSILGTIESLRPLEELFDSFDTKSLPQLMRILYFRQMFTLNKTNLK